jgi:hypothetical protein
MDDWWTFAVGTTTILCEKGGARLLMSTALTRTTVLMDQ